MTYCKARLEDYVSACGSQRAAALKIGVSESTLSLILGGKRSLLPEHAARIEADSSAFRADDLLPEVVFVRSQGGRIVAYQKPLEAA